MTFLSCIVFDCVLWYAFSSVLHHICVFCLNCSPLTDLHLCRVVFNAKKARSTSVRRHHCWREKRMMADQKSIEQRDDGAEMFREYIPKETMLSPFHLTTFFLFDLLLPSRLTFPVIVCLRFLFPLPLCYIHSLTHRMEGSIPLLDTMDHFCAISRSSGFFFLENARRVDASSFHTRIFQR